MNVGKAVAWWEKQGINAKCEVYRVGHANFGNDEFVDVFWKYKGDCGRDRIRKNAKSYVRELLEV